MPCMPSTLIKIARAAAGAVCWEVRMPAQPAITTAAPRVFTATANLFLIGTLLGSGNQRLFKLGAFDGGIRRRQRQVALGGGGDRRLAFAREDELDEFAHQRGERAPRVDQQKTIERIAASHDRI